MKELLIIQAEKLHNEAALLSNSLHEFKDEEVNLVKPLIEQIIAKREEWKAIRRKIQFVEKTGVLPEDIPQKRVSDMGSLASMTIAEMRIELSRLNVNISKYAKKLQQKPDARKAEYWKEELTKMTISKDALTKGIAMRKYETA